MEWIEILKCPITGKDIRALTSEEIFSLNQKISEAKIFQADGQPFNENIQQGLITVDGQYIYPIIKNIVLLLRDLAVVDSPDKVLR